MGIKTMAVFGGTGGIGKQTVPLLREKYSVMSLGSKDVDLTSRDEVDAFFMANDIDIVVNMSAKKHDVSLSNISLEDLRLISEMIDLNIMGNINLLSVCLPHMGRKGWGRVIAISSIFAEMNVPNNSVYCASKAFLDRLISVANRENAKYGVTCNTIQLGYWEGGMNDRVSQEIHDKAKAKIGLHRFGTAEELCRTIDFIVDNEYVCGTNLKVDGGVV